MLFREFKILPGNRATSTEKCATPPHFPFQSCSDSARGTTVGSISASRLRFHDGASSLLQGSQHGNFPTAAPTPAASTSTSAFQFNPTSPSICPPSLTSSLLFKTPPTLQGYSPTLNSHPIMQISLSTAVNPPELRWNPVDPAGAQWLRLPLPLTQTSPLSSAYATVLPMVPPLTRDCHLGTEGCRTRQPIPALSYHSMPHSRHCAPVTSHGAPVPPNVSHNARKSKGRRKPKTKPPVQQQQQPQPMQRSAVPSISELFPGISAYHGSVLNPLGSPALSNKAPTAHSPLLDVQRQRQLPPLNLPATQATTSLGLPTTLHSTRTSVNKGTPHLHCQDVTEHPTPPRTCCSPCGDATSSVWELCQPVRCIIDQNEVEIIPGTGTSRGSERRNSDAARKRRRRVPRRYRSTNSPDSFNSPQTVGFPTSLLTAIT